MTAVACFWVEPIASAARFLRRYHHQTGGGGCPADPHGYHQAYVRVEDAPLRAACVPVDQDHMTAGPWRGDARWPVHCRSCPYLFVDADYWQVFTDHLYQRPDTGEVRPLREWEPGAMFHAWWHEDVPNWTHPVDRRALTVRLPDGTDWNIDGPSFGDGQVRTLHAWTRTGTPPKITAQPSIQTPRYHGFLTDGVLRACGEA